MIKVTANSKLFIWGATLEVHTGGIEVLNLLAATLKKLGVDVVMFNWAYDTYERNDVFSKMYDVNCGSWRDIQDTEDTIILLPEVMIENPSNLKWFSSFKHTQFIIWWLSSAFDYDDLTKKTSKRLQACVLKTMKDRVLHLCESELTAHDLEYHGIRDVYMLQHGVNHIFYEYPVTSTKEKAIVYNGLKDINREFFDTRLRPIMPDVEFRPIMVNFNDISTFKSKEELCDEYYDKSMVYVSCSHFEGREMMPREACVRNCILFVDDNGCASIFKDYPLRDYYKYDPSGDLNILKERIYNAFETYDERINDFTMFRRKILLEPRTFLESLYVIFEPMIKNKSYYDGFLISDPCASC